MGLAASGVVGAFLIALTQALSGSIDLGEMGMTDYVALGIVLALVALMGWVAWSCRIGALPFRFVVDPRSRKCGYRWGSLWTRLIDLTEATGLEAKISYTSTRAYMGRW